MTDLHARRAQFKEICNKKVDSLMKASVDIIRKTAIIRVSVSCKIGDLDDQRLAYPVCTCAAINMGAKLATDNGYHGAISFCLESGDKYSGAVINVMKGVLADKSMKDLHDRFTWAFTVKGMAAGTEAADILAWEWARDVVKSVLPDEKRQRRISLIELLSDTKSVSVEHLSGCRLAGYVVEVKRLLANHSNRHLAIS